MAQNLHSDLADVAKDFKEVMKMSDNLVAVHRKSGGNARGKRSRETSLNGAIVLNSMAAWQVVVEGCASVSVKKLKAEIDSAGVFYSDGFYSTVKNAILTLATPNYDNTLRVIRFAGFDPKPSWDSIKRPGRSRSMTFQETLDGWLKIRHSVAHGDTAMPTDISHVSKLIGSSTNKRAPTLTEAESCMAFVRVAAKATGDGLADHLGIARSNWT